MNVRTWLAVSVYMVIVQAFVALKDGVGPHTGEHRLKYGHINAVCNPLLDSTPCRNALAVLDTP